MQQEKQGEGKRMKIPMTTILNAPQILASAAKLNAVGQLGIINNTYLYLKIDDTFIHQLYPLIQISHVIKPEYFGVGGIGAHISVIYPEENKLINISELKQEHEFTIKHAATAQIREKLYYAVLVESTTLLAIRKKYNLPELLSFKGYDICFHITIGYK